MLQLVWLLVALFNFIVQILYFTNDSSGKLYLAKRITTPALLWCGLLIVLLNPPVQWIPLVIFAMMGLGEIGIEGSSVVEKSDRTEKAKKAETLRVTIAGILFLLVNVLLGIVLIVNNEAGSILIAVGISLVVYLLINLIFQKSYNLNAELKFQTRVYSLGLVVLLAGVLCDLFSGLTSLGLAALILTISDTLVLIRMAANWDKKERSGYLIQLTFLIVILLLYYFYMAVLFGGINL